MKESKKIESKLKELSKEKEELFKHLKPVPQGSYKKQFIGYRTEFTGGSIINAVREALDSQENATYRRVLTYQDKPITKEKLKEVRSQVIQENEPYEKRIKEIDELIPILNRKLIEAKADELLKIPEENNTTQISDTGKFGLSGHGELKAFVEMFIKSPEFIALHIPKHQTLKINHKQMIEDLLKEKYPDHDIKLNSFYTILRKLDYSKSREKY